MKTIKIQKQKDEHIDIYKIILICILIGAASIQQGFLSFLRTYIRLPLKLDVIVFYLMYLYVLFKSITFLKTIWEKDVLYILLFFFTFFSISFFLPNTPTFLGKVMGQLAFSILCYTLARSLKNFEKLYEKLQYLAFPIAISVVLQLAFFQSDLYVEDYNLEGNYNQYQGYLTLSAAIISLSYLMNRFNYIHLITFLLSLVLIVIIGARGPLISLLLFYFLKLFYKNLKNPKGIIIIMLSISLVCFIYLFYLSEIIEIASVIIKQYGFSTRLIDFANSDSFIEDDNRNSLFNYSTELIKSNPILGLGIARERIPLNSILMGDADEAIGNYPHNIFVELFLHFGIIIGIVLIYIIFKLLFISLFRNKNFYSREIITIFLGIGLFPLFFSGSYLNAPYFFVFLGFCYNSSIENKNYNNSYI